MPFKIEGEMFEVWVWFAEAANAHAPRQGTIHLQTV
jgi:hypothetical protein